MEEEKKPKRRRRPVNADAPVCKGKTAKGLDCTHRCKKDKETGEYFEFCGMHNPLKEKKVKKPRLKVLPTHTHAPGERDPNCQLCLAHGDALDPWVTDAIFDADEDTRDRILEVKTAVAVS
ncbi:MAG: hypothetical protein CMB57_01395 [Euryarchaeota archaeon]|nr:hypothetical protein [Euryarchaeota archaeon]